MDLASFNDNEKEFLSLTGQLPSRVTALTQYPNDSEQANGDIRRIDSDLTQAKQLLNDMEMAARGLSEPTRRELGSKVNLYRNSLSTVSNDLNKVRQKFQRNALMGGAGGSGRPLEFDKSQDQRQRMMDTTQKLQGGTDVLNDAHRRLEETLDVGEGIMSELGRNRETLNNIRGNVGVVGGSLDEARRILRSMGKREVRTKLAVAAFAIIMIGIIIGLIVWMANKGTAPQ